MSLEMTLRRIEGELLLVTSVPVESDWLISIVSELELR
jgi:hypothetical protein